MQRLQMVRQPRDGVRLAAARRVLDQVALAGSARLGVRHQLAHGVELVEAREDDLLHRVRVGVVFHANEPLDDVEQAVGRQDLAVQVLGAVAVRVGWVARAVLAVAPVEGQEERLPVREPGAHFHGLGVQREVHDRPPVRLEQQLLGASVGLVLLHGVLGALSGEVVLQLHGHDRYAVQEEHDVHGVVEIVGHRAVAQLPHHLEAVGAVALPGVGVLLRRWPEITQAELRSRCHADAVSQHVDHAAALVMGLQLVAQALDETLLRVRAVQAYDLGPFLRLCLANEADEGFHLEREFAVVVGLRRRVAVECPPSGKAEY